MSVGLRYCELHGWVSCDGNCGNCETTATTTTDGFWYHGSGKLGGEFYPNKPDDKERYGEYVKVKHGRWIKRGDNSWECSVCHEISCCNGNYCVDCGARMDGRG